MKRAIILSILLLVFGTTVFAQPSTAQRISFDPGATSAAVSGSVDGSTSRSYVLYAFAGQQMSLTLNAGTLTVVSPSGIPMVRGTVVADPVRNFSDMLPETGDYTISVSVPAGTAATNYTLNVSITGSPVRQTDAERISFAPGATSATVNGWVSGTRTETYALYAFAGQDMELGLDFLAGQVTLIAPSGTRLLDRATVPTDFVQIFNQTLPETGDYRIQVSAPSGTALTPYRLDVAIDAPPSDTGSVRRISFAAGAISATVSDTLNTTGSDRYVLYAFAGQQMSLTLNAGTMTVVSPSGVPLVRGTVAGTVRSFDQTLPETGDYMIIVNRAPEEATAAYNLTATVTGAINRHDEAERISFMPGATGALLTGTIGDTAMDNYLLYAFAGQTISVNVENAYLTVVSPDGTPLARAQAGATNLTTTLPKTGDYRISISNPVGTGTVNYTLTVSVTG